MTVHLPVLGDDGEVTIRRPRTRAECADVPRPCPFVGCRFNTYLDVGDTGDVRLNSPLEPNEVDPAMSCALDVADDGGASLRDVGRVLSMTRERARQIEARALDRMKRLGGDMGVDEVASTRDRAPTMSRQFRRADPVGAIDDEVEEDDGLSRVSFFADDETAVLAHVWRIYGRASGRDTRSKFSRAASEWRAANPNRPSSHFRHRIRRTT